METNMYLDYFKNNPNKKICMWEVYRIVSEPIIVC